MIARCDVCKDKGDEFSVPWDGIGAELMRAHFVDKHPGIMLPGERVNPEDGRIDDFSI